MKSLILYLVASLASSKCMGPNNQKTCNMSVFSKTTHFTACCHILLIDTISDLYHNDRCILHLSLAVGPRTCEE